MLPARFEFENARVGACVAKVCFSGCQEKGKMKERERGKKKSCWQGFAAHMDPALHDKKKKGQEKKKGKDKNSSWLGLAAQIDWR